MEKQKQIEEIKDWIDSMYGCDCAYYGVDGLMIAEGLYNAGYRKQRRGVWISVDEDVIFKCSICEAEISSSWDYENEDMFFYCPCCGANMKGAEDGEAD